MNKTIKVPSNEAFLKDVQILRDLLGVTSLAEAIRRAVARELVLLDAISDAKALIIKGGNPDGETLHVLMDWGCAADRSRLGASAGRPSRRVSGPP